MPSSIPRFSISDSDKSSMRILYHLGWSFYNNVAIKELSYGRMIGENY